MFRFIKKIFFAAVTDFGCNALKCVSMNNQKSKIRPKTVNLNSNKLSFYSYSPLVAVVIILIIYVLNYYAFLMLFKKWISNYVI